MYARIRSYLGNTDTAQNELCTPSNKLWSCIEDQPVSFTVKGIKQMSNKERIWEDGRRTTLHSFTFIRVYSSGDTRLAVQAEFTICSHLSPHS